MELESCIKHLCQIAEQYKQAANDGFGIDIDRKSVAELAGMFQFSADHMQSLSETVTWTVDHEKHLLDGIKKAWGHSEDIQSLYADASDSECRCGIDPEGHCPHCSAWEKADKVVAETRFMLEDLLPTDVES
jgi:hypothetical protein